MTDTNESLKSVHKADRAKVFSLTVSIVLLTAILCGMVTSCGLLRKKNIEDIYGWWEREANYGHYVLYIHDDYMEFFYFKDENEEQVDERDRLGWLSYKIVDTEESRSSFKWKGSYDYDRSRTGTHWEWDVHVEVEAERETKESHNNYEYKDGKIYDYSLVEHVYTRSKREHPLCVKTLELRERYLKEEANAKPLELGEIKYFPDTNLPEDSKYQAMYSVEITNPNPFRIYSPQLVFYKEGQDRHVKYVWICDQIEAESSVVHVGYLSDEQTGIYEQPSIEELFGPDIRCEIHYNIYDIRFPGQENSVEVASIGDVTKDQNGMITEMIVGTRGTWGNEQQPGDSAVDRFTINIVFYKDNEITGVGCGTFNMRTMDRQHTVTNFSAFGDYDYLEVYIT